MKLLYLFLLILFISCSSTTKDSDGSELYSGRLLYTAGPDHNQPDFDASKLDYLILHDLETGISKKLTTAKHRDNNPIFLNDEYILFESKRPCSGYATDDCPLKLFKMSITSGNILEFNLAISGTIDSLKAEIGKRDIYQSPIIKELNLLENTEHQLRRPKLNSEKNLLAFSVQIFSDYYLVVYDMSKNTVIYTYEINFSRLNYYWSPNENRLAHLGAFTDSDRPIKIIDFDNDSTTIIQLPLGQFRFSGWSSDGDAFLLSKPSLKLDNRYFQEPYLYHLDGVITEVNNTEIQSVEDWIYVTPNNHFIAQMVDSNNKLDLWFVDSEGNGIERITNNGYRKKVTDIQLQMP